MKKFCSECGHPLEISKKFCSDCGTLNPFFSISQEIPSARSSAIDTLRARKESIEKELEEIEREQKETLHKEKLRVEMEELEKQRLARLEKEKEIKERFEREGIEASIKKELQQVKTETEQYQQQTTELLKELKGVVLQIDEENKKLKEEVQQIAKAKVVQPVIIEQVLPVQNEFVVEPEPQEEQKVVTETANLQESEPEIVSEETIEETSGNSWVIGVVILLVLSSVGLFFYLYTNYKDDATHSAVSVAPAIAAPGSNQQSSGTTESAEQVSSNDVRKASTVETPVPEEPTKSTSALISSKTKEKPVPATKADTNSGLTTGKAKTDLLGKTLSGCGITLKQVSEIISITTPVLVEESPSLGYVKYKLSVQIIQEGETYNVTPYLYYTPAGKFMRIDAANCE